MEGGAAEKEQQQGASYTYWVRKVTDDAAPMPVPQKLAPKDVLSGQPRTNTVGSVWNHAGTWEEKSLNSWATKRMKELIMSVGSLEFSCGRAEIEDVTKCVGDAFMVIVRNKKRVGYTYELTLKVKGTILAGHFKTHGIRALVDGHFKTHGTRALVDYSFSGFHLINLYKLCQIKNETGEWMVLDDKKLVDGHIDVPEFSVGEVDDLKMEVRLSEVPDLLHQDKIRIKEDLKLFLKPVREKLVQFEQELKDR